MRCRREAARPRRGRPHVGGLRAVVADAPGAAMSDDDDTYDLTLTGLTEGQLRNIADNAIVDYLRDPARAKLAEIDAERAAAVKATERRVIVVKVYDERGPLIGDRWQVLASDLRPGDVVEGRTVERVGPSPQGRGSLVQLRDIGSVDYYPLGVLVLLDSEAT